MVEIRWTDQSLNLSEMNLSLERKVKSLNIIFLFFVFSITSFGQTDSTYKKYAHVGLSLGSGLSYGNFNNLLAQGYMLGLPDNLTFPLFTESIYFGRVNKFFGSVEFAYGYQGKNGSYSVGSITYTNMHASVSNFSFALLLHPTLYCAKHFAFNLSAGPAFANDFVSSINTYNNQTTEVFANGQLRQASFYFGTLCRVFWQTKSADWGFSLKAGYCIPLMESEWWYSYSLFYPTYLRANLSGYVVSISGYLWPFSRNYLRKNYSANTDGHP